VIRKEARKLFHHMKRLPRDRLGYPYCAPAAKGAVSDVLDPKTTLVWMYPAAMACCEAVFAQPLINAYYNDPRKAHLFLTGVDALHRIARFVADLDEEEDSYGIGLDFSQFDILRANFIIKDAFGILNDNLCHGSYWDPINGVVYGGSGVARRSEHAFWSCVDYFINTPMILPNGRVVVKHLGIPSGSHFTNLIDSIVNRILIYTFSFFHELSIFGLMTNGDDSAFRVSVRNYHVVVSVAEQFFKEYFDMLVKVQKSCIAGAPSQMHASGVFWTRLRPHGPTQDWFELALYPKAYVRDPFEAFQRMLGIGIAGAFTDHKYCDFFTYYQTGYDIRSLEPELLSWTKLRWLQYAFGDLPLILIKKNIN